MKNSITKTVQKNTEEMDYEPFVSVLTPVYNGEEFLRECIESVLAQDYTNWEYVLVNNQSTDSTLPIMEDYAARDPRIRIHNNDVFLPQMENLNHAFRHISPDSKYCKVVHADDLLLKNCLKEMVAVAEAHPSVGIVSAYRLDGNRLDLDGLPLQRSFYSGDEIAKKYLLKGFSNFGSPSSLLIRSDLIRERDKIYDESYLAADTGACLGLLKHSDFGFAHQVLTVTRVHDNSITNTVGANTYAVIHGLIKLQLEYGPHYLNKHESERRIAEMVNMFYILLARNIIQKKSIKEAKRQLHILESLGLEFKTTVFLKNFVREIFIELLWAAGFELKRKGEPFNG